MDLYVVGLINDDDSLGGTFLCNGYEKAVECMNDLLHGYGFILDDGYWDDNTVFDTHSATFFLGLLENA